MTTHELNQSARESDVGAQSSPPWTLRAMQVHFALVGLALLLGALSLVALVYQDFDRIDLGLDLRIDNPGAIYAQETQITLFLAVSTGLLCLFPFRAVAGLIRRYQSSIRVARVIAVGLLTGIPVAGFMALFMSNLPDDRADMTTSQQFIDELTVVIYLAIGVLVAQSVLALWYQVWLSRVEIRELLSVSELQRSVWFKRVRVIGLSLALIALIALAVILGVLTDWLYERPIAQPEPGELLYVTSFDAFNAEWDLYGGRDTAEVVNSEVEPFVAGDLSGNVLAIQYGAGLADGIVWSVLDRKFNDFDLRVTTQWVDGPFDQNKIGVGFRYKDKDNFYYFGFTADGYYGLVKVTDGVIQDVSQWGFTDLIDLENSSHEIRIVAQDHSFQFFVDGVLMPLCLSGENEFSLWQSPGVCWEGGELTTVYQDETFKQGRIALAVGTWDGSDIRAVFDDLLIIGPAPVDVVSIDNDVTG